MIEPVPRSDTPDAVIGLVLAAGAGARFGLPKALVREASGRTWVERAVTLLATAGCRDVLVVTGARAEDVEGALPAGVTAVRCADWSSGLSASLRTGLLAAAAVPDIARVVVVPVDTPGLSVAAIRRVLDAADATGGGLARATYSGEPGHPVVLAAPHLGPAAAGLTGDRGAREYLERHGVVNVDCSDVAVGDDVDTPEEWARWNR